jgi:hypothetical protein
MSSHVGYVDNTNGQSAHYNLLALFKALGEGAGWETLRYDDAAENHEWIFKAPGYTGEEEIFGGIRTYQNANADYYNILCGAFTGYVAGNTFDTQPGGVYSGVPTHNQRIDYWININPQRVCAALKVGTPVYESLYLGKILPYARPSQYPYPLMCAGMLNGAAATRFSDTSHAMPYKGARANCKLRTNDGWIMPRVYPWSNRYTGSNPNTTDSIAYNMRDTGDVYPLLPAELHLEGIGILGALEGIFYITGFNNVVEDTIRLDGVDYIVIEDVSRTSFPDYYALRLD